MTKQEKFNIDNIEQIEIDLHDENLLTVLKNLHYDCSKMILIPESDYGFAEIYRIHDDYLIFLIPTYGGVPYFYKSYDIYALEYLIKDLKDIT